MVVAINKVFNYARMTTATAGTGTITLGSAVAPYLTFAQAGVADGDVVYYSIVDGTSNVECGIGTYTAAGTTLSRTTVLRSSGSANTGKITLSGSAEVHIEFLANGTTGNFAVTAGQIPGTATNDTANAGNIGEVVTASRASASSLALVSGTQTNIVATLSLTAGDWDVSGVVAFSPGGATVTTILVLGINTVSATLPGADSGQQSGMSFGAGITGAAPCT
jgi:hypothetical protein